MTFFIGAITPFAMGAEPYIIYWIKKRGLSLKEATALVASFTVINPFVQVLITWPSFFILCAHYNQYIDNVKWIASFWSVFVGLIMDLIGTLFWTLMSYSKNAHYFLNLIINWFKKILKMKYKSKDEIRHEYKENAAFKKLFIAELKDWKFVLLLSLGSLTWNALYYCTMIFAFNLMDPGLGFNAGELFNYTNVATTANNFIPIPGAEGTLQATISIFIQASNSYRFPNTEELSEICNNSVFIWRTFTFYITAILGLLFFIVGLVKELYKYLVKKNKIKNNNQNCSFTIVINHNGNLKDLLDSLVAIKRIYYYYELVQILIVSKKNINKIDKQKIKALDMNCNIDYINDHETNQFRLLKKLNKEKLLKNDYILLINSGDEVYIDILMNVNNILHKYDVYAYRYKQKNEKNNRIKNVSAFKYIYKKRIFKTEQMISNNILFFNMIFNRKILNKVKANLVYDFKNFASITSILANAYSLRFMKRFGGFRKEEYYDSSLNLKVNTLQELSKNGVQDIFYKNASEDVLNQMIENNLKLEHKFYFLFLPWYYRWINYLKYNKRFSKVIKTRT